MRDRCVGAQRTAGPLEHGAEQRRARGGLRRSALGRFAFDTWPTLGLLPRILELAPNATAYDAAYVALAEEIGSVLVTTDAKIARIPGIHCRVVVAG